MKPALDVDANGRADAYTDGLMLIRYLSGLRGSSLTSGANRVRNTRPDDGGANRILYSTADALNICGKSVCAMYSGVSASHSAIINIVGTRICSSDCDGRVFRFGVSSKNPRLNVVVVTLAHWLQ